MTPNSVIGLLLVGMLFGTAAIVWLWDANEKLRRTRDEWQELHARQRMVEVLGEPSRNDRRFGKL